MTNPTPAQEFLSEVREINGFITDILACPRRSGWHWPSFYLLYVDVDRLAMTLMRAELFFNAPFSGIFEQPVMEDCVDSANDILDELGKHQKAVVRWLWSMCRHIQPSPENPGLRQRLDAHVHPKSGWYQEFFTHYAAGTLSADGKTLVRTVLPVLADPSCERIDHGTANFMLRHQSFGFGTPEEQQALARATGQAAVELGKVAAGMQAFLVAHCTLEDLLHPCSA